MTILMAANGDGSFVAKALRAAWAPEAAFWVVGR